MICEDCQLCTLVAFVRILTQRGPFHHRECQTNFTLPTVIRTAIAEALGVDIEAEKSRRRRLSKFNKHDYSSQELKPEKRWYDMIFWLKR